MRLGFALLDRLAREELNWAGTFVDRLIAFLALFSSLIVPLAPIFFSVLLCFYFSCEFYYFYFWLLTTI